MKKKYLYTILIICLIISTTLITTIIIPSYAKYINKKEELKKIKTATILVELKEDLTTPFLSEVKVSDFITNINGDILNDYLIDTSKIDKFEIPENLMRQMRSSVILVGGLLGKHRKATFSYPGGCDIGTRPIELHLKAFEKLGININKNYGNIECFCDKIVGEKIDLDFPSVRSY